MRKAYLLAAVVVGLLATGARAVEAEFNRECALGLAMQHHVPTDCSVSWTADNGKTYCFSSKDAKSEFLEDVEINRTKAEVFWSQPQSH
jgi:YHS domain-containing protein